MSERVLVREVQDSHDAAIVGFGQMQEAAYFAPETLIPARYIPQLLTGRGEPVRLNFLLVAELDGRVVGGTLFHWLATAGVGFSSFMGVARELRGQGIGRRLHEQRFVVLDRGAGRRVPGVFIDVVSPIRMSAADRERERTVGSDPWDRRHAFAHLGFRQVDIRYQQPVGGPDGGPVTILDLLFCPREPRSENAIPTALVMATMEAYWSGWMGEPAAHRYALELAGRADGRSALALIPADAGGC
jgi:GNAT superfamily N-acetyltransferase